jgi:hypothetical protein
MTAFIGDDGIVHLTHGGNPRLHVHVSAKGGKDGRRRGRAPQAA